MRGRTEDADSDWWLVVASFESEKAAQDSVDRAGKDFVKRASKTGRLRRGKKTEDAVVLCVEQDGELALSDAAVLRHRLVRKALMGIGLRLVLGLHVGATVSAWLTARAYAGSRGRARRSVSPEARGPLESVIDGAQPGDAVVLARCTPDELEKLLEGFAATGAKQTAHAAESEVMARLETAQQKTASETR